jgi:ketosteroid isomerase-like protein
MRALYLAPIALLLAACGSAPDPDAVIETVRATEQAQLQAIQAKDLRGAVRNYDHDATLMAAGRAPVAGAEAIEASFETMLADPNLALTIEPGPAWASASGDLAVTTFTGQVTTTDPATTKAVTLPVRNETVWRKAEGAPWKIVSEHNVALPAVSLAAAD